MVPEDLVFVIVSKLMSLERDLDILLQNLKTVMDYFESFLMTILIKCKIGDSRILKTK